MEELRLFFTLVAGLKSVHFYHITLFCTITFFAPVSPFLVCVAAYGSLMSSEESPYERKRNPFARA